MRPRIALNIAVQRASVSKSPLRNPQFALTFARAHHDFHAPIGALLFD